MGKVISHINDLLPDMIAVAKEDAEVLLSFEKNGGQPYYLFQPRFYLFIRHFQILLLEAALAFFSFGYVFAVILPFFGTLYLFCRRFAAECSMMNISTRKLWFLLFLELTALFIIFTFTRTMILESFFGWISDALMFFNEITS